VEIEKIHRLAMDRARCPGCGDDGATPLMVARDLQHGLPGEFPVVSCRGCGLVFLSPQPSAEVIARHYPARYYETYASAVERLLAKGRAQEDGYFQRLSRLAGIRSLMSQSERTVLDVGCGCGLFLFNMARTGWRTVGLEPSAVAVTFATERLGLDRVLRGDLTSLDFPEREFDLITMWHVLEHIHDPVGALRRIRPWLRPEARLALCVPNIASLQARLFGRFWFHLDAPRHLVHFSPATLEALLARAGFEICERERRCDNTTGWAHSLRRLVLSGLRPWLRRSVGLGTMPLLGPAGPPGRVAETSQPRPVGSAYAVAYRAFHLGLAAFVRPPARVLGLTEAALGHHAELLVLARRCSQFTES
jgi:2-polyprenyl-3-methyl-5-hydroxy-6-metoxy-1,4-benzoquinol methylase